MRLVEFNDPEATIASGVIWLVVAWVVTQCFRKDWKSFIRQHFGPWRDNASR